MDAVPFYNTATKIVPYRFPLGNAVLFNLVSFEMSLSFHSVLVTVNGSISLPIKENARVCSTHFCNFVGVVLYTASKPKLKSDACCSIAVVTIQ